MSNPNATPNPKSINPEIPMSNNKQHIAAFDDWDAFIAKPTAGTGTPEFIENSLYRAKVVGVVIENSIKYPGTKFPRVKFIAFDKYLNTKPVSWIPQHNSEIRPAILAIDQDAGKKPKEALIGCECCVRITLSRGVTVTEILPMIAIPGPTLGEQGL